ncbi:MAG: hypothetical protein HYX72_12740 [Acidobacteria bacterium]|nr:hypothetical protein [Acidobacteriota bacterium]
MLRIIGLSLLLLGIVAPSFVGLCNSECAFMHAPQDSGSFFDEALPPCCVTVQAPPVSESVQPKAKFRHAVPLHPQTLPTAPLVLDSPNEYLQVCPSPPSTVKRLPILRI